MVAPSSTANPSSSLAQPGMQILSEAGSYAIDAVERWLLFLDVMQRRSEQYKEHLSKTAPHVLKFDCELVIDGRQLRRPVNYGLVRVKPPAEIELDKGKRPFIVVDPRAGHGPGIAQAQENEQRRIARELHDQVGQTVTGLSLGLKRLERKMAGMEVDEVTREHMRWLQSLAVEIDRDIHRTAADLRPTALDDLGLHKALSA
jgi:hypothetical protein